MYFNTDSIPVYYGLSNILASRENPSTVHGDSRLTRFFSRYLLQKAMSPFDFDLPEDWAKNYFLYTIYCNGLGCVFDTDKYGLLFQHCGIGGQNIYYQPYYCKVSNPLLTGTRYDEMIIGEDCELVNLQPDYGSVLDIVQYYADLMAVSATGLGMNILNSKLSYVFMSGSKNIAESFKKLFDKVASGEPAVFADKELFDNNGELNVQMFNNELNSNFIAPELLEVLQQIDNRFDRDIGLPNSNYEKRERLIMDEVNANNFSTRSKCEIWLETLQDCFSKVNRHYGTNISVKWREDLRKNGNSDFPSNSVQSR